MHNEYYKLWTVKKCGIDDFEITKKRMYNK